MTIGLFILIIIAAVGGYFLGLITGGAMGAAKLEDARMEVRAAAVRAYESRLQALATENADLRGRLAGQDHGCA